MFGFRAEIVLQITHGVAAIGQKHDLLIHLQTLRFQHLVKPALGLGVVLVDECKHLGAALGLNTLAGNDLEPTFGFRLLVRSMHIAAVQADRQGGPGGGCFARSPGQPSMNWNCSSPSSPSIRSATRRKWRRMDVELISSAIG